MMTTTQLPSEFTDLQPYVDEWALRGQTARYDQMLRAGIDQLRTFYDAMMPRMDAVIAHLNRYDIDAMPPAEQTLFNLAATFAETAHPIDFKWKKVQFDEVHPIERIKLIGVSEAW
ncbi:hypothetical protein ASE85_11080 [Sphingobium sp. Leaf26]|uniref:hypothetical protein n=1 Tax=Sphingobium sp. Leaf26 TaxID=1735693 RepID=UPI000700314F|nr:hypothetical protein [Sphingobium sp. Leaf26]KQM99244.1 hypothetical protein ASE85_11080 [Sphingobium sp. Leaf26]